MVDFQDPDVIESLKFLLVSQKEKMKTQSLPFDGKRSCWIPDIKEGFISAVIEADKGDSVDVSTSAGTFTVKKELIQQMNPPKYEKCNDMADLTYLNDATVLHNLRSRYKDWFIYVRIL